MSLVRCGGRGSPAYDCSDALGGWAWAVWASMMEKGTEVAALDGRKEAGGGIETRLDTRLSGKVNVAAMQQKAK